LLTRLELCNARLKKGLKEMVIDKIFHNGESQSHLSEVYEITPLDDCRSSSSSHEHSDGNNDDSGNASDDENYEPDADVVESDDDDESADAASNTYSDM
jgi:hypothetical protein